MTYTVRKYLKDDYIEGEMYQHDLMNRFNNMKVFVHLVRRKHL